MLFACDTVCVTVLLADQFYGFVKGVNSYGDIHNWHM